VPVHNGVDCVAYNGSARTRTFTDG
jgi:hypothetical protein